jgi:hypothetical protein
MLVHDSDRGAAMGVGEHDVARAVEAADRVAHAVVVVIVEAHAGGRDILQEHALDMPMVVEAVRHVELEACRARQDHAAARMHEVHLLAYRERILDAQERKRLAIGHEQHAVVGARRGHGSFAAGL